MHLHMEPLTLAVGLLASLAIALLAMAWGVWRVGKVHPAALLAGSWGTPTFSARGGRRVLLAGIGATLGGAVLLTLPALHLLEAQWAFLGGGAVLLLAAMCWLAWLVRPRERRTTHLTGTLALARLGMRNAGRRLSRSVLTMGLLGFATFILVTVAAFRHGPPQNTSDLTSGSGGYTMILRSDIPLPADPSTLAGRRLMGIRNAQGDMWNRVRFTPLHRHAGQDTSCLNLTRVTAPTIVDVPSAEAWRGRFTFARQTEPHANPWALLETPLPGGDVPMIADDETARYLLQVDLGGTLTVTDSAGRPRVLRLVATLAGSVFQGELMIGRGNFRRLFPSDSGFGLVLIEAPPAEEAQVRRTLSDELADYAVTVDPTSQVLGQYLEVANTYLSTFQTLGALGLMLGTIGLAVVLLRNLIERRAELAVLSALGFSPAARMTLVMSENLFLLLLGLLAGVVCALIGVLPNLAGSARTINLVGLAGTLGLVLAVGLSVLLLTMALAGRRVRPADLREE